MRYFASIGLFMTLAGCFDFTAAPFGEKGLHCDRGGVCDDGLLCNAQDYCIDPCEDVRCGGHGDCGYDPAVGAICTCDTGFVPSGPDCLEIGGPGGPCGPSASCSVGLTCIGNACVEACSQIECGDHGTCGLQGATPQCDCDPGYHPAPTPCVNDCLGVACGGHGVCSLVDAAATCTCDSGYSASGLTCVADNCVANGSTTLVCEGGHILDVDSCERRIGEHENCGHRGCGGTACNAVTWSGYGTSEYGPWQTFQDLSTAELSGVSRTVGGSFRPSACLDLEGRPVVAWQDTNGGASTVVARRWSGSAWVGPDFGSGTDVVPGDHNSTASVVITAQDQPLVGWIHDPDDTPPVNYVRTWGGTSWTELGGSGSGNGINPPDAGMDGAMLALLPSQKPVVAWSQQSFSNGHYNIFAKQWTGSAWAEVGSGSASGTGVSATTAVLSTDPSIAIDSSGRVNIAWAEGSAIIVARYAQASWTRLGTNVTSSSVGRPRIASDPDGTLYVTWQQSIPSENYDIFARRWTGSQWVDMGAQARVSNTTNSSFDPDIATTGDGRVFVAWSESLSPGFSGGSDREVFVRVWNGITWDEFAAGSATGRGVSNDSAQSGFPAIAVDETRVCIAWENFYVVSGGGTQLEIYLRCATR